MKATQLKFLSLAALLTYSSVNYAAIPIDLSHQSGQGIRALTLGTASTVHETSRDTDFNQTLHIRFNQLWQGKPVWGGEGVMHVPHAGQSRQALSALTSSSTTMNGIVYADLQKDLAATPVEALSESRAEQAKQHAIENYKNSVVGQPQIKDDQNELIVFVDKANRAHWAYHVYFYAAPTSSDAMPAKQNYLIDAVTLEIYKQWNDIKSENMVSVNGGGIGGNQKTGKFIYDGNAGNLGSFTIMRDDSAKKCELRNDDVIIKDSRSNKLVSFPCEISSPDHGYIYWNNTNDSINGGYSPNDDAIFTITRIKEMYDKWYHTAPVMENGHSVPVTVYTHINMENAYWEGKVGNEWIIKLGDGGFRMYPSTAPGVIAHELAHGFTEQHANLFYEDNQSGGLNESFSDMADQAAQFYALGKNNWMHDAEIMKAEGKALRYLDKPSKDCEDGKEPGVSCSIDHVKQLQKDTNVHFSSGIYNHVFYLIGTSKNWDAKKAFDVMVKANMHYWTAHVTFEQAACGVISATKDYKYNLKAVLKAFDTVGVNTKGCA